VVFQSLSYRFGLRSDDPELGRRAEALIAAFAPPIQDGSPSVVYSIRHLGEDPRYRLERDDRRVAESDDARMLIGSLLWSISNDTVQLADGYLLIHAGAVVTPSGDGLLILGESGSGKTTLVAALVQEGFGYLSDEAAAIELATGLVHPWPRPLGFWPESSSLPRFSSLLAPGTEGERHVTIEQIRPGAVGKPCRVQHVIDHRYGPGSETRLQPLSRGEALVQMGSAAPPLRHEGNRGLSVLAGVVRGARTHSLISGDLELAVQAVRTL
jgi:hypothetical protein